MSDREKSLLDDVTWWPLMRRHNPRVSAPKGFAERRQNRVVGRQPGAAQQPRSVPSIAQQRRRITDEYALSLTLEEGFSPGIRTGYDPYNCKAKNNDVMPWNPRRR